MSVEISNLPELVAQLTTSDFTPVVHNGTTYKHKTASYFVRKSENETIDGVKTFNSGIVSNVTGNLNGNALYAMNFDLVIDSDAKLAQWASSGTYAKVLIKAGTWTLASGGVDLTARGTKLVVGEPGSKLVFSSADKGLYYTTLPKTKDYQMNGVTVECTSTGDSVYGFFSCTNLTNCTGTGTVNGSGFGFYACTNLTNCTGTGTGTGTGNGYGNGFGFYACTNLTNCTGTGNGTGAGYGFGFHNCEKCQQNMASGSSAKYASSYADSGASYPCADTPNGGFNS